MNGMRKVFGFLILMAFAAFALPAAAQKVYTLNLSTSTLAAGSSALPITATMNNISPDQGNSTIKSFKLWAPAGITIKTPATSLVVPVNIGNGYTALIQNNGSSIYLSSINLPLKPFAAQPLVLSMTVDTACTGGGAWTTFQSGKFQVWNGSAFTGQNFDQQAPSNLTTTFAGGGCNGVVYNGNGSTGGTVPTDSNLYGNGAQVTVLGNTGNLVLASNYFTGWTANVANSGTVYVAGSQYTMGATATTFYAKWAPKALTITSSPTSAVVDVPFDVIIGSLPAGAAVTVDATACPGATWPAPTTTGSPVTSTKFTFKVPAPGACSLLFNAADYVSVTMPAITVYKGQIACGDYDSSLGPPDQTPKYLDPYSTGAYVIPGGSGWGLRRGPNKDGSDCTIKVNYTCDLDEATAIASCSWDKTTPQGLLATFAYVFVWKEVDPDANGWKNYQPLVSWGIASPGTPIPYNPASPSSFNYNWTTALACIDEIYPVAVAGNPATYPDKIFPNIPGVAPFTDSGNVPGTYPQYQPGIKAGVCVGQQGSTSVGNPGGPVKIQFWHKVNDYADVLVKGPS